MLSFLAISLLKTTLEPNNTTTYRLITLSSLTYSKLLKMLMIPVHTACELRLGVCTKSSTSFTLLSSIMSFNILRDKIHFDILHIV